MKYVLGSWVTPLKPSSFLFSVKSTGKLTQPDVAPPIPLFGVWRESPGGLRFWSVTSCLASWAYELTLCTVVCAPLVKNLLLILIQKSQLSVLAVLHLGRKDVTARDREQRCGDGSGFSGCCFHFLATQQAVVLYSHFMASGGWERSRK